MAYGRYRVAGFLDDNGIYYQIDILKENYVGGTQEFTLGDDGFTLNYRGQGADIDDPIKSSEVKFKYYSEGSSDDSFFLEVMNAKVGTYLINIAMSNGGNDAGYTGPWPPELMIWRGILVLEQTTLADDYYPQGFQLRAIDGLSLLKSFKVSEITNIKDQANNATDTNFAIGVNGAMSGSWYSHHNMVVRILALLPSQDLYVDNYPDAAFLQTAFEWWSNNTTIEEDIGHYNPMTFCFTRSDAYYTINNEEGNNSIKYMNCYQILEGILRFYNARICMTEGSWKIIQLSGVGTTASTDDPIPTQKLANWNRNGSIQSIASPVENRVFNVGDLTDDYDCQRAEAQFTFSPGTRDLELQIADAPNLIFGPGEELGAAEYDYAALGDIEVDINSQPTTNHYTNTYVGGSAGDLITFVFNFGVHIKANQPSVGGFLTMDPLAAYFCVFRVFIRQDNYWLVHNPDTNKFEWETTQQTVYDPSSFAMFEALSPVTDEVNIWSIGSTTTDGMEELPSDGAIMYKVCYRVYKLDYATESLTDVTAAGWAPNSNSIDVNLIPQTNGNYGSPENFVTVGLKLFLNGEAYDQDTYFFETDPNDDTISGNKVKKSSIFFDGPAVFRKNNIFYLSDSGFLQQFQWGITGSWYYRSNPDATKVLAQVIKGAEYLNLTERQRIMLQGKILRKQTSRPYKTPLRFDQIFNEVVTGFGNISFLFNGGKYNARKAEWSGEWISLNFTDSVSSGKVVGNKPNNHFINHILINNLILLEKENNHKKIV